MVTPGLFSKGFFTKIFTGIDNTLTNTPVISAITKTRIGKLFFLTGMFAALIIILFISMLFGSWLSSFSYSNLIAASLLVILAACTYFDFLIHKPREMCCSYIECELSSTKKNHILKIAFAGFLAFIATGIDEVIAYSSLMLRPGSEQFIIILGIIIAAVLELIVIYYFSRMLSKIKGKEKFAACALVVLAVLVGFNAI